MTFRLVDTGWNHEMISALHADHAALRIVCPFIKKGALVRLLRAAQPESIRVITRFNLTDFAAGVSDLSALRLLVEQGAQVRGVRSLHAKLYLFGANRALATSANLTDAAMLRNHEFGFVAEDPIIVKTCGKYFTDLWARAGPDLTIKRLSVWEEKVSRYLASGARPGKPSGLGDEGVNAGATADDESSGPWALDAPQAFVKFLGEGNNREPLSFPTLGEVQRAGCHWALAYPGNKRPTGVKEGAMMFIARLTSDPHDIRIFGRAIGMAYKPVRDDATSADIALRSWKKTWPRYIRVHHAEFLSGTMQNGISLNELMDTLKSNAFAPTQRNVASGNGNVDPRRAYQQQAAVELSGHGRAWLNDRLTRAFATHGKLSPAELAQLDWPKVPRSGSASVR